MSLMAKLFIGAASGMALAVFGVEEAAALPTIGAIAVILTFWGDDD